MEKETLRDGVKGSLVGPQIKKKACKACKKYFLTYLEDMEFCNSSCEDSTAYKEEHYGKKINHEPIGNYKQCACPIYKDRFCGVKCRQTYWNLKNKEKDIKESNSKEKKKGNRTPLHILNQMAEKRRVFDDKHSYWYTRRGASYGRPDCY